MKILSEYSRVGNQVTSKTSAYKISPVCVVHIVDDDGDDCDDDDGQL